MFKGLSQRLSEAFEKLKGKGVLSEEDVSLALREVRIALLEADVALPVVKQFINSVKEKAIGQEVLKSVSPAQMVVKIVNDHLVEFLGDDQKELSLQTNPPSVVMMVGLQGSGKTSSTAKLAKMLQEKGDSRGRKKVLMASLDIYRPAAQHQLSVLGDQTSVDTVEIVDGQKPVDIAKRALSQAKLGGYDVLFLDTAGRLHIDDELMAELKAVKDVTKPSETMLVADALTGQDAVNIAQNFNDEIGVTGIMLTRIDGDARGGAALSMKTITGCPIKYVGVGEQVDKLEAFHPERIAGRILDMGDVVTLVEKAAETIDQEEADRLQKRMQKGKFDLNDMASQMRQIKKMGGMSSILKMMPGAQKLEGKMEEAGMNEDVIKHQLACIDSMTQKERRFPKLLNASRKKRIAMGAGVDVANINRLLKQYQQMEKMMKRMNKLGKKGMLRNGLSGLFN